MTVFSGKKITQPLNTTNSLPQKSTKILRDYIKKHGDEIWSGTKLGPPTINVEKF